MVPKRPFVGWTLKTKEASKFSKFKLIEEKTSCSFHFSEKEKEKEREREKEKEKESEKMFVK
jgi:hypothetical protein